MAGGWGPWIKHDGSGNPASRRKVFVFWDTGDYDVYMDASKADGWEYSIDKKKDDTLMRIVKYRMWVKP